MYEAAKLFVTNCAAAGMPVFLRFAHEANGDWYPWHGTAANAADFRAAYRRVVTVMRKVSPQ